MHGNGNKSGATEQSTDEINNMLKEIRKAFTRHTQCRLIGFLLQHIQDAQDAIQLICAPEDGKTSEQKKRWMVEINDALQPWLAALSISGLKHTQFEKIGKLTNGKVFSPQELEKGKGHVVYARVNLKTRDMYIGETGNWQERVKQHYMKTLHEAQPLGRKTMHRVPRTP